LNWNVRIFIPYIMNNFPTYVSRELVLARLSAVFPEGTANRNYLTRELAASTVFTMLYIGAVEGNDVFLGPIHVYRMTIEQASLNGIAERLRYRTEALRRSFNPKGTRWYADNTREPIRDETLREGLVQIGAVIAKSGIATTSRKPRYCLQKDFSELFNPDLTGEDLENAIVTWRNNHLSASALTRLNLATYRADNNSELILVTFPNKETRHLAAGLSSAISKAVIEIFSFKFLEAPALLWLSTSDNKVVTRDDKLANKIGLKIEADKDLPDIILVDLEPHDPLIVFIEVVATDGAINERRQNALYKLTDAGNFKRSQITFVTAYHDRESAGFRKTIKSLAWKSFAWFVSEPDKIVILKEESAFLSALMKK